MTAETPTPQCKERVCVTGSYHQHQCSRKAWKDGYCKQHHPESVKARMEKSQQRYEEQRKQSSWYKLGKAQEQIAELERRCAELEQENAVLRGKNHTTLNDYREEVRAREELEENVRDLQNRLAIALVTKADMEGHIIALHRDRERLIDALSSCEDLLYKVRVLRKTTIIEWADRLKTKIAGLNIDAAMRDSRTGNACRQCGDKLTGHEDENGTHCRWCVTGWKPCNEQDDALGETSPPAAG